METLLGGSTQTSTATPIAGTGTQNQFFQSLFGGGMQQNPQGFSGFQGLPQYLGQLSPNLNEGLLASLYGQYSPTTQGTNYMSQMLGGNQYSLAGSPFNNAFNNMTAYGGQGGYLTDLMHSMAQYGGTGGAGNAAMGNLLQFGAAGPAGQPLNNMAQFGTSGTWGNPLQQTAQGGGPANSFLWQFNNPMGTQALQQMIAGGGNPINQTPAWNAMVESQQRGIGENMARLQESMGSSGNRFSTAYGTATADYLSQTSKDQNALLGQMMAGAGENAQNRLLSAGSTLGGYGLQAGGQQSAQTYGAGGQLANLGAGAAGQLSTNSMYGAGQLFGGENQGALSMYGAQNQLLPAFMGYNQGMLGLGQQSASGLNSMLMGNLGVGAGLGQGQLNNLQSGMNNQYQNWWQSLPQNNPLLPYMFGAATGYTGNTTGTTRGGLLPGLGALAGGLLGSGGLLSDYRLKEDIKRVGQAGDLDLYTYRFKGQPDRQLGFIAQEVAQVHPEAAFQENGIWMIKPGLLLEALAGRTN